jgi:hypothetical protein
MDSRAIVFSAFLESTDLWIGASPVILYFKSIKFPQLTRYFKSLLLACVAASFKFWRTDLANLSLLTSKGVSEN